MYKGIYKINLSLLIYTLDMVDMEKNIWHKYLSLRESIKDEEMNRILEKISAHENLSDIEKLFLKKYDEIVESDLKDLSHLSKNLAFDKISKLLERGKKVICDLYDKDGQINDEIISIHNDFEHEECILDLKHGERAILSDRFLYNIDYDIKKDIYSVKVQDEYFEKIKVDDED